MRRILLCLALLAPAAGAETRRWAFDAAYRFGAAEGATTRNDAFAELRGLLGPSLTKEFQEDQFFVEALVGLEAIWKLSKNHSISFTHRFFPALNDLGEYRNLSSFAWKWKLLDEPRLSLIAGVGNEYESSVESGRKHDDLRYTTALGIDF